MMNCQSAVEVEEYLHDNCPECLVEKISVEANRFILVMASWNLGNDSRSNLIVDGSSNFCQVPCRTNDFEPFFVVTRIFLAYSKNGKKLLALIIGYKTQVPNTEERFLVICSSKQFCTYCSLIYGGKHNKKFKVIYFFARNDGSVASNMELFTSDMSEFLAATVEMTCLSILGPRWSVAQVPLMKLLGSSGADS